MRERQRSVHGIPFYEVRRVASMLTTHLHTLIDKGFGFFVAYKGAHTVGLEAFGFALHECVHPPRFAVGQLGEAFNAPAGDVFSVNVVHLGLKA